MVVSVNKITDQGLDKYDVIDQSLIPSKDFIRNFGDVNDYIEAHVYTKDDRLLQSDYAYRGYSIPTDISISQGSNPTVNSLIFDPATHIQSLGYNVGDFKIDYRIYRKKIFDLAQKTFFISEISSDRTEVRIISNLISNDTIELNTVNFIYEIQSSPYFKDFLINFGDNKVVNAINIALDKNTKPYSIVIKLYQPLPAEFDLKSSLWIVEELADPIQFEVELVLDPIVEPVEFIGPPNFDLNLDAHMAVESTYQSLNSIYSTDSLTAYQNIVNKLHDNSIGINVDYSDFSNFIHFSSALERLSNFVYKLQTIEEYNATIATLKTVPNYTSGSISANIQTLTDNITGIIQKFDGYESYLYNVSGSTSWPKTGTYPNYTLSLTTSPEAIAWIGDNDSGMVSLASEYDKNNQDNLVFSVPEFISNDDNNQAYLLFLNMVGQHFDNVWIYIKAMNDIHKANNSFQEGISKDMVYTALRSLGIKLYNNNTNENVFDYFIGNASGSYTVSGSNQITSGEDRSKELFKRVYHNLPYLLKSKGTTRGLKALITTFGIPETILDVIEYGGSDKFANTLEYVYDRFSYALDIANSQNIDLKWAPLTQNQLKYGHFNLVPDAIEFRFKPDVNNISNKVTLLQQFGDGLNVVNFGVTMDYTSSAGVPSANVNLLLSDTTQYISSSLTLPLYATGSDGEASWWNLLLTRKNKYTTYSLLDGVPYDTASVQEYDLYIKNAISGRIGHQASASIYATGSNRGLMNYSWSNFGNISNHIFLTVGSPSLINTYFPTGSNFNGQLQEIRYWSEPMSEATFNSHVLSNESYEGNYSGSAFSDLAARFPLGNNLITYNHSSSTSIESVHPNYTVPYSSGSVGSLTGISLYGAAVYGDNVYGASGSLPFLVNENKAYFFRFPDTNNYSPVYTTNYTNAPNSGYYAPVTDKVRIVDNTVSSSVLSPYVRMEAEDLYRSKDLTFTDVSFSPQNEINKDIIAEYGGTVNIDDIIGDPSSQYGARYSNLDALQANYYKKFKGKYNFTDFIRLIKSVDNTLFKMIEDYVPARTNLSTGVTIKSPILERNRAPRQKPDATSDAVNDAVIGKVGVIADSSHVNTNGSEEDFITGVLSGSVIDHEKIFKEQNKNPYLLPTASINESVFQLTDFNTQQGVVNRNRTSSMFQAIDPFNDEVLDVAEIQDGYYTYQRHSIPRYLGSKSTSAKYNVYTPGDNSYGKNAAIDSNVLKFGWVDSINAKNLNFYNKTTINLKHLVDASGSLTELNSSNKHLFEVQNTFKSGDQVTVSLLDKTRPTNQSTLNGSKEIFLGGFSYSPILFRELDETLTFDYLNPTVTESLNLGIKAYSTRSYEYNAFDGRTVSTGHPDMPATNTAAGYFYKIDGSDLATTGTPMAYTYYTLASWPYSTSANAGVNTGSFGGIDIDGRAADGHIYAFDIMKFNDFSYGYNTEPQASAYQQIGDNYYYVVPRSGNYNITGSVNFSFTGADLAVGWSLFKPVCIVEKSSTPLSETSWSYVGSTVLNSLGNPSVEAGAFSYDSTSNTILFDRTMYSDWNFTLDLNLISSVVLTAGTYIRFRFYLLDFFNGLDHWTDFKFTLGRNSYFEIYDSNTKVKRLITSGSIGQIPDLFTYDPVSQRGIIFNDSASLQFYTQSVFIPQSPYADNYSPVTDIFDIQPNDLFRFGEFSSPSSNYYEVESVTKAPAVTVVFKGTAPIPSGSINQASFAILRKVPDETSVMLNFNKIPGETSKAILIPNNLLKVVADDVANIIQPLRVPLSTQ